MQPTAPSPRTRAELTQWAETSSHADVMAFVAALTARRDPRLRVTHFGATLEGRTLPLLVLSQHGCFTPAAAHASGRPVVLVVCGIHAGEVEGKEALLMLVRDLLDGRHGDLLAQLTLVVVPLFNADGNDRMNAENRRLDVDRHTGQLGPELVGTRNNAAGINLNRDYLRQDAAEMRLLQTRVCQPWNAHLVIDCHATNGSIHRFALTYDVPHTVASGRREPIDYMRTTLLPAVRAAVKQGEGLDTFFYGNFLRDEGGEGFGWITYPHHPRFGGNYRGLTNRLDLLLEAYSYIPFAERVRVTYAFVRETLRHVAAHAAEITALLGQCTMPPQRIAVRYRLEALPHETAQVLTRDPYTLDGAAIVRDVPHLAHFVPELVVDRPLAYALPAELAAHLEGHGLRVDRGDSRHAEVEIATVRGSGSTAGRAILEANVSAFLDVTWRRERRAIPDGWALVFTEQPRGAIAVYLGEAGSDDGVVACGWLPEPAVGADFPVWRVTALT